MRMSLIMSSLPHLGSQSTGIPYSASPHLRLQLLGSMNVPLCIYGTNGPLFKWSTIWAWQELSLHASTFKFGRPFLPPTFPLRTGICFTKHCGKNCRLESVCVLGFQGKSAARLMVPAKALYMQSLLESSFLLPMILLTNVSRLMGRVRASARQLLFTATLYSP